jgi:hypothetical protein
MIDNFNQIKKLLTFNSEDDFYFLQIIKRKKEHPEMPKSVKVVHTFYISSKDKLDELKDEIIHICEYHDARAYINLNKRSFEKLAYQMLKQVTDCIMNKEFRYIRKSFNTVCGRFSNENKDTKKWIIDVDEKNISPLMLSFLDYECEPINIVTFDDIGMPIKSNSKIYDIIKTKNGWHIITKPFNIEKFKEKYPNVDIHKDSNTILYCK